MAPFNSQRGLQNPLQRSFLGTLVLCLMFGGLIGSSKSTFSQTIGASISGTVTDPTGAVIPNAQVKVRNVGTEDVRSVSTDVSGSYRVAGLSVGGYEATVEMQGFSTQIRQGITLTVGQQAVVDFTLQLSSVAKEITVNANASQVEATTSTISGLVDEKKIRDLPLNGRDYTQLTLLQAGASAASTSGSNPLATSGAIARYTVNGIRPTGNNFLLDGMDVNDPSFNLPLQGVSGQALGVEAIQEFRILTNTFSAQYGRNAGAIVNAISKTGTNAFHGSAYEFLRNSTLDARNFFDKQGVPPFKRNNFGFTVGGPIIKDKTFFFGNYEGFRERLGVTTNATVPDENARKGTIPILDPTTGLRKPVNVGVAPGVQSILNLYPLPNGRNFGDGSAEFLGFGNQSTRQDYFLISLDHRFSAQDHLFGRYSYDDGDATLPFSNTPVPGFTTALNRRNQFFTLQYQKILSPRLINEARFGFTRIRYGAFPSGDSPVSISLFPGPQPLGTIALQGISPLGFSAATRIGAGSNIYEYSDGLSYAIGKHFLNIGGDIERFQIHSFFDGNALGSYNVGSLLNFLQGKSVNYLGVPPGGTSQRDWRQTQFAIYAQDDYKVKPNLTLNLGLRYAYSTVPNDIHGRNTNIRNPLTDAAVTIGNPIFENPTTHNFAPRFGFAWTPPIADHKTVIRGGFGLFYDNIWENIYGNTRFQPPFFILLLTPNAPFPVPPPPTKAVNLISPQTVDFHLSNPYSMQYNLNIQRDLGSDILLTVAYVGSRGVHLFRVFEANTRIPVTLPDGTKFFPPTAPRQNPNFGTIRNRAADADSNYNSMQVTLNRRFTQGLQFQVSYTLSKLIDDSAGPFQTDTVAQAANSEDPLNRKLDSALSPFDVRQNLVVNYTYDLPFGPGKRWGGRLSGPLAKLAEGWQINGIDTFQTGHPFSIVESSNVSNNGQSGTGIADRPNLTPGFSNNPTSGTSKGCPGVPAGQPLGTPNLYFDPCAFSLQPRGFLGNLGRNTLTGPGLVDFDFSVVKNTRISESKRVEFRAEFFNLFNRANFQVPSNVGTSAGASSGGDFTFDANGNRLGNAGKIFSTVTTSRQIQFGLKLIF